jgi:hypothetical protein
LVPLPSDENIYRLEQWVESQKNRGAACVKPQHKSEIRRPKETRRRSAGFQPAVSQVFNLHRDRIYLHRLASLSGLQDEILRYSKICATFRFGAQKKHLRNPGYPRLSSSFGSGYARLGFPVSDFFRSSFFDLQIFPVHSSFVIFSSIGCHSSTNHQLLITDY